MTIAPVEETPLYVILREQEEYGPFCRKTLKEAMETGNLVPEDWVRKVDRSSCWMSVGQLLYGPPEPEALEVKIRRLLRLGLVHLVNGTVWLAAIVNRELDACAAQLVDRAGTLAVICIGVATGILLLPGLPLAVAMPWMLGGFAAGVALILRRSVRRGLIVCLAASLLPIATHRTVEAITNYFDPNRREIALPPIGEMSNMPRKSSDIREFRPRAKSGIPALGLPQPTEDEK